MEKQSWSIKPHIQVYIYAVKVLRKPIFCSKCRLRVMIGYDYDWSLTVVVGGVEKKEKLTRGLY